MNNHTDADFYPGAPVNKEQAVETARADLFGSRELASRAQHWACERTAQGSVASDVFPR